MDQIQRADEEDMPTVVDTIVSEAKTARASTSWVPITKVQSRVMVASTPAPKQFDSDTPTIYVINTVPDDSLSMSMLVLPMPHGKAGQRQFMEALPRAIQFTARHLDDTSRISVRMGGESELDAALGIAMVVLEALFDGDGRYTGQSEKRGASWSPHAHVFISDLVKPDVRRTHQEKHPDALGMDSTKLPRSKPFKNNNESN